MVTKKDSRKQTSSGKRRPAKRKKASEPAAPTAADVGAGSKKSAKTEPAKERKLSALSGAAQVLAEADEPLGAGEIVKRMLDRGLWQTKGRTPQATLYAVLLRRIRKDGANARFRKVERGKFALNA